MRRLLPTILAALSAVQVHVALAQDTPACVPTCSNQVRDQFSTFACPSADDASCLCASANFYYGIRDCSSTSCGATDVEVYDYLSEAGNFCQGLPLPVSTTSALPSVTSTIAGVTTQDPATATPTTSVEASTSQQATLETSGVPTATQETALETSSPTPTASPVATTDSTSPESTPTATSSGTETTSAAASETSSAHSAPASSALSQAAVIGIGVGVGAGVIAIASVAIFLLLRNRKQGHSRSVDASKPPPGSGRAYPTRDQGSFEKYSNDIEMVANRYEDMVPRQKPRTMV